jgi:Tfp pilus assembly protein PilZ
MVRYGTSKAEKTAFTRNISESGMFLQTNAVFKPGTTIQVRFEIEEQPFTMWARVVWAKKVPPQLAHILGCGMGICFIEPSPEWVEFIRRRHKNPGPPT